MPLAVPRKWQGVDQRRLVTGTHGVKCDTLVETSLVCAQSLNGSEGGPCSVCETVKGIRSEVAIWGVRSVLSIRAYGTARLLSVLSRWSDY
jgi:hypothetical protein